MKERPLIFSAPMIRAILDGRKTQSRRVVRPQPAHLQRHEWNGELIYDGEHRLWCWKRHTFENLIDEYIRDLDRLEMSVMSPFGIVGDKLWCKETWTHEADSIEEARSQHEDAISMSPVYYRAGMPDDEAGTFGRWMSPLFMPRWASRITLEIVEVRVQRLQEISDGDARAEGVEPYTPPHGHISPEQRVPGPGFDRCRLGDQPHRLPFADLWDKINDRDGRRWADDPFVWCLTFRRVT